MSSTSRTRRTATAAAWVAAGAVGASAVTGLAFAATGSVGAAGSTGSIRALGSTGSTASVDSAAAVASPAWAGTAGLAGGGNARRGLLRTVLHGRLTVKTASGTATIDVQRGTVTAASASSVTVASSDGFTATYAVAPTTVVRRDRQVVTADRLVAGDAVFVRSSGGTAQAVRALSPAGLAKLKARLAQRRAAAPGTNAPTGTPTTPPA